MKIVNLTPHPVIIIIGDKKFHFEKSGKTARINQKNTYIEDLQGIPLYKTEYGKIENLPDPEEGKIFITSYVVAKASNRDDVVFPVNFIRNDDGVIIGCSGLGKP